jgi:hypothetical protein
LSLLDDIFSKLVLSEEHTALIKRAATGELRSVLAGVAIAAAVVGLNAAGATRFHDVASFLTGHVGPTPMAIIALMET